MINIPDFKKNYKKRGLGKQSGFIKIVIIIIAALVLLKYIYDIDVVGFLTEGKFRGILDQGYKLAAKGWEKYKDLILMVWNYIVGFFKNLK